MILSCGWVWRDHPLNDVPLASRVSRSSSLAECPGTTTRAAATSVGEPAQLSARGDSELVRADQPTFVDAPALIASQNSPVNREMTLSASQNSRMAIWPMTDHSVRLDEVVRHQDRVGGVV
jgi:hypothetical protein